MADNSRQIMDPETGKPRLNKTECATCVFGPTHAHLRPGRIKEVIESNIEGGFGLVCHETITYDEGRAAPVGPAFCRGYYDRFGHQTNYMRICERLGGFTEVDPPTPEQLRAVSDG